MPTFIPNHSMYDAEGVTEEGGNCGWCSGALTVTWGSVPLSHLPLPVNVKLPLSPLIRCASCAGVLPFHSGIYVAFPPSETHVRLWAPSLRGAKEPRVRDEDLLS